jgi:hypothetical protein
MDDDPRDPLAAFDDGVAGAVAAEFGLPPATLRALVRRHQETVRRLPGVEDVVYEWRRSLPVSPLVERRSGAYLLAVPGHVWPEFREEMALSDVEYDALRAVHARQFVRSGHEATGDREPMVLTRE